MKKLTLLIVLIMLSIGIMGCQEKTNEIDEISIYQLKNGSDKMVLDEHKTIQMVIEAVSSAQKLPGIVNMADPAYRIEVGVKTYSLWIDEASGTIMDNDDTHTIYSLSEDSIKQMNKLISASN